jgi:hypothetical protein
MVSGLLVEGRLKKETRTGRRLKYIKFSEKALRDLKRRSTSGPWDESRAASQVFDALDPWLTSLPRILVRPEFVV